jgi:hypothetical protein
MPSRDRVTIWWRGGATDAVVGADDEVAAAGDEEVPGAMDGEALEAGAASGVTDDEAAAAGDGGGGPSPGSSGTGGAGVCARGVAWRCGVRDDAGAWTSIVSDTVGGCGRGVAAGLSDLKGKEDSSNTTCRKVITRFVTGL